MKNRDRLTRYNSTNVRVNGFKQVLVYWHLSFLNALAPKLVEQLIRKLFFIPRCRPLKAVEKEFLDRGERFFIKVNGEDVVCWRWGSGPSILFAHGWNGRGIQFRTFIQSVLEHGYSAIAFDGPGHGESGKRSSSYFQMTDAVRALLKDSTDQPLLGLIGHSFGAAAIVNAQHKEHTKIPAVLLAPALQLQRLLDEAFQFHGVPLEIFYKIISHYENEYHYKLTEDNPAQILPSLDIPVLIIHDEHDQVVPVTDSKNSAQISDNLDLMITTGLGHSRILKNKEIIEYALDYLTDHRKSE